MYPDSILSFFYRTAKVIENFKYSKKKSYFPGKNDRLIRIFCELAFKFFTQTFH